MKRTALRCAATTAALTVAAAGLSATPALSAATLVVDASESLGPVTHAASGGLYALAENERPDDSMLHPIRMRNVTQPAPGSLHEPNGQPPGGDALLVAPQADRAGAGVIIRMPDIYPDFPYQWVSWEDWLNKVDTQVQDRLDASTVSNVEGYELWNEPGWTWDTEAAGPFNEGWVRTFERVRSQDPVTPIIGPSISSYREDFMRSFLTHARDTGTLPEVVCWHELQSTPERVEQNIADYRALERELGISPRPIAINEYGSSYDDRDKVDQPGPVASYIAKLERGGVDSANRAFWYEYGTVNGLVTDNDKPTGTWWLYKWYGDMTGRMVGTEPPARRGLDGFAAYDEERRAFSVVFGDQAGDNTVRVTGLEGLGRRVHLRVESTPASGRFTHVPEPATVLEETRAVEGGEVEVEVPGMTETSAYRLVVESASGIDHPQRYEAENASVFRAERLESGTASNGGYVGRIDNSGDFRTDSYVDFTVNVPESREYTMTIGYANGTGAVATHGLAYNGGPWSTVEYPATGGWGEFGGTVSTTVDLHAGYNVIRLAKGAPHFGGATGYTELDYIELD
ncbi:carbohydrate-binding protein [Streptomonospora algeriensis]|uniref:Carbohydrate-binding protein n=1 Tax=Streptomonospora algeriensis TaxID=995084 RepID=A0ABW3BH40_9ACTN